MPLENFRPEIYSDMLMVQRPQETVFAKLCKTDYSGEIYEMGDTVHFTGLGRPTVHSFTEGLTLTEETMTDNSVDLVIDTANYFNVVVNDIEKKQSRKDPTPDIMQEGRRSITETLDNDIATLYSQAGTTITQTQAKSTSIISSITGGVTQLYKNNVPSSEQINLVVSPDIAEKIMLADIVFNTDNSETIDNGWVGRMKRFVNVRVWMSNAVYINSNVNYCMMFTKKAIALAEQIPAGSIETFRSPTTFADVIRVLHLYGKKVIKPKELVTLALKPVAETTI